MMHYTLNVKSFAGRMFCDFASFSVFAKVCTREIIVVKPFAKVYTCEFFFEISNILKVHNHKCVKMLQIVVMVSEKNVFQK